MGSPYKRGDAWWINYYRNGKCFRESGESTLKMVRLAGFEPATYGLEVRCSIQLSYRRKQNVLLSNPSQIVHKKMNCYYFNEKYIAFNNTLIMIY